MKLNVTLALGATLVPALLLALSSAPAAAGDYANQGDPGVARISDLAGGVDVRRADANDSYAAALNAPVNPGDYVTTQDDSRAEVEFDYAALLRVGPDTQIRFTQLEPNQHTLQLAEGTVELRVLRGLDAHPEVDTPSATIRPGASGRYRITVTSDGNTEVTVREGRADVALGDGFSTQTLGPGSTLLVTGQGSDVRAQTIATVAYEDFDRWTDGRDARYAHVDDWAYVDHGLVGADDLGQYGHWTNSTDYGQVWVPTDEPADWAPYTDGRWVWEPYYGWTWVSSEPWGWAPYHYGRWFYAADAGWCWYPGAYGGEPFVYSPALVGFFGYGIDVAFGNIGWTPLAPFETFHPWWGRGGRFFGDTFANQGNAGRFFRNAGAPGGVVGVSGANFAAGHFEHIQPLHGSLIGAITPVRGVLPILPTTHNLALNPRFTEPVHLGPLSPHFEHLTPVRAVTPLFDEQRQTVAALARQQFPHLPTIGHDTASERTPGWDRFSHATPVESHDNAFHQTLPVHESVPARDVAPRMNGDVWNRFGEPGGHAETFERAPERANSTPERSPIIPRVETFSQSHAFSQSVQPYSPPARSYSEPVRSYSAPERSFSAPARSYSAPARSYSAPVRSYSAPARSFSAPARAPARSYSPPAHASSGSARGGDIHNRR